MAKRGRTSQRQRAQGEAVRRAAAAARLAHTAPAQRRAPAAVAERPMPAQRARRYTSGGVRVSHCPSGCPVCAEAQERFNAIRAHSLVQRRRYDEPDRYPYAAGKRTLHRVGCREVAPLVGQIKTDDSRLYGALSEFAHEELVCAGWGTHMWVMDSQEAAAWITERIGPRGGTLYRLCRICTPELPTTA